MRRVLIENFFAEKKFIKKSVHHFLFHLLPAPVPLPHFSSCIFSILCRPLCSFGPVINWDQEEWDTFLIKRRFPLPYNKCDHFIFSAPLQCLLLCFCHGWPPRKNTGQNLLLRCELGWIDWLIDSLHYGLSLILLPHPLLCSISFHSSQFASFVPKPAALPSHQFNRSKFVQCSFSSFPCGWAPIIMVSLSLPATTCPPHSFVTPVKLHRHRAFVDTQCKSNRRVAQFIFD